MEYMAFMAFWASGFGLVGAGFAYLHDFIPTYLTKWEEKRDKIEWNETKRK
tara:strand:+ start:4238 stop:4390 length:153 start_codon:yes stop_codon:yes gene_type:complete